MPSNKSKQAKKQASKAKLSSFNPYRYFLRLNAPGYSGKTFELPIINSFIDRLAIATALLNIDKELRELNAKGLTFYVINATMNNNTSKVFSYSFDAKIMQKRLTAAVIDSFDTDENSDLITCRYMIELYNKNTGNIKTGNLKTDIRYSDIIASSKQHNGLRKDANILAVLNMASTPVVAARAAIQSEIKLLQDTQAKLTGTNNATANRLISNRSKKTATV